MMITSYHAKYFAHELTKRHSADDPEKLARTLVNAQVDLNPHQVDAARQMHPKYPGELDQTLELPFVLRAVDCALKQVTPVIWNSDQGSHFTSSQYLDRLVAANIQISMDGRGRAGDNIFTERLWRSVKYEEMYLNDYASPRAARCGLARFRS
jgi:hypothetical protein